MIYGFNCRSWKTAKLCCFICSIFFVNYSFLCDVFLSSEWINLPSGCLHYDTNIAVILEILCRCNMDIRAYVVGVIFLLRPCRIFYSFIVVLSDKGRIWLSNIGWVAVTLVKLNHQHATAKWFWRALVWNVCCEHVLMREHDITSDFRKGKSGFCEPEPVRPG